MVDHDIIDRFEQAWHADQRLDLKDFVRSLPGHVSQEVLQELVLSDLEFQWRRGSATGRGRPPCADSPPLLEQYLARLPGLGPRSQLTPQFIAEEYLTRQRWGDGPSAIEYQRRFPEHWPLLRSALARAVGEFCTAQLKIFHHHQAVFSCALPPWLEIGRQRASEPRPFHLVETELGQRLVIAPIEEVALSRKHLICEPCGPSHVRIACTSRVNPVELLHDERLQPGETRKLATPLLLIVGAYGIRLE